MCYGNGCFASTETALHKCALRVLSLRKCALMEMGAPICYIYILGPLVDDIDCQYDAPCLDDGCSKKLQIRRFFSLLVAYIYEFIAFV